MNRVLSICVACVFSLASTAIFSQKKNDVAITGTVYISSSISPGVIDGKVISEVPHPFRNQIIYFKSDSPTVKTLTDSVGVFSIQLKEGTYIVHQENGLSNKKDGLNHFGTDVVEVKKGGGSYKISFHNSSNRRSTMNSGMSGKGLPDSKATKTTKKTSEK